MFYKIGSELIYRKVHTREPLLVQEMLLSSKTNDGITKLITGKTNFEIENFKPLTDFQAELKAQDFKRLIERQKLAQNRSGDLRFRIKQMEEVGYEGLWLETSKETKNALSRVKSRTIAALNDCQIFRICSNNTSFDALQALEKEFAISELQKISERNNSTIINTWLIKYMQDGKANDCLTNYIHELARK